MHRVFLVLLLLPASFVTSAQKKKFTFRELFGGGATLIMKHPPFVEEWVDDNHYLESRLDSNNNEMLVSVHALTGKAVPYTKKEVQAPLLPTIPGAMNITASPDGKYAAYTKENNLYVIDLATQKETALSSDGSSTILNGYASWVYFEEILGRASQYKAFWWSPDSKKIAYMRFDDSKVPVFPIYVADGQHGYLENAHYPKAGDTNPEVKIGIVPIETGITQWADFNPSQDQYFGTPYWTPENKLWVQWMNRGQDSLIVYEVNNENGTKKKMYEETQPTWIQLDDPERFYFLPSGKGCLIKSDRDGWQNLYLYSGKGKFSGKVTNGNFWDVSVLHVDEKKEIVYFKARKESSARYDVYKASFNGKKITRLTFGDYSHDVVSMSPSGKYFITMYSNLSTPPVMVLLNNEGKKIRELGTTRGERFDEYDLAETRLVTVRSSDGKYDLPLTITYPLDFDSTRQYPVWISVYGGPDATSVYDRWKPAGGLTQWWAQEGLIQVTMDNRSSGHFGKKGMNEIFEQMGKHEISDFMDCAEWLRSQPWADPSKIGITGGSFGGYMTCMALTYGADVFTHGLSNFPVTDWKFYDTHYTERFMNTPQENPEGYRTTSVLTYVDKYRGMLRIVHGSTDDNVHMQNSIRLIDTLQDLNRHFEMMIYPNQRHGIRGKKAMHNFAETCRFVYRYLLEKDAPPELQ